MDSTESKGCTSSTPASAEPPTVASPAEKKGDEHGRLVERLRSMTRDLEIRSAASADAVRHLQGMTVADQFLVCARERILKFGQQESQIYSIPQGELPSFELSLEKIRVELLETMSAARGVLPSAWAWPEVTVAARSTPPPFTILLERIEKNTALFKELLLEIEAILEETDKILRPARR